MLISLLSSCATKPKVEHASLNWQQQVKLMKQISNWTLKARIAVKKGNDNNSSSINWQHHKDTQRLKFYGALGTSYGELYQNKDRATLTLSADEIYEANSLDALVDRVLGYPLPISHLDKWLLAMPSSEIDSQIIYGAMGFPRKFKYKQWTIEYNKYKRFSGFKGLTLPSKLKITDGQISVRISVRGWSEVSN